MKNIFKIKIHFFFYLAFIISILTGNFKIFITLTLITFFHELGHIIGGLLFKYKIEKIVVLPLSMLTIFNTKINNKWYQEFIITILGPLFQILLFNFINDERILKYNMILLLFNLLPIFPLDGSKLLKIFLYNYLPFKLVEKINIYISFIVLVLLNISIPKNLLIILVSTIFLFKIFKEKNNLDYIFNKFLFERYLYNINYKKIKIINQLKLEEMYKYYYHHFLSKNKIEEEHDFLLKMFDNKGKIW